MAMVLIKGSVKIPRSLSAKCMMGTMCPGPTEIDKQFRQKSVRVTILGADTPTGEPLALLLKLNPIVSQIYLYGSADVVGVAADLEHFDTRSKVKGYFGVNGLNNALRRADIVVLVGEDKCLANVSHETRLRHEAEKLIEYTKACTKYAPKSLIAVCVRPVATTLPMVSEIFKQTHWYHPGRIVGSSSLQQMRINALAAQFQNLDPAYVHVPIIGGPDLDTVVPLFSRAQPVSILPPNSKDLYRKIKQAESICEGKTQGYIQGFPLSEAFCINQLVTTMAMGLCGDSQAVCSAFIRQNIVRSCRYLVSSVRFGPAGVDINYGVPIISKTELRRFERATFALYALECVATKVLRVMDRDYQRYCDELHSLTKTACN